MQNREEKLSDAANLIENNLVLLGATAIEDKLQDKVGFFLIQAGGKAGNSGKKSIPDLNFL